MIRGGADDAVPPSNQEVHLVDAGRVAFDLGMQLAFRKAPGGKATCWIELPSLRREPRPDSLSTQYQRLWLNESWCFRREPMLVLFWSDPSSLDALKDPIARFDAAQLAAPHAHLAGDRTGADQRSLVPERFMTALDWKGAADSIWNWLRLMPAKQLGPEPDLDGSCSRGFRISTALPHPLSSYGIVAVTPEWAEYHK